MKAFSFSKLVMVLSLVFFVHTGCGTTSSLLSKAPNFLSALTGNQNLSTYLTLLNAVGGLNKILPGGVGTLLVPSNDALAKVGGNLIDNLTRPENLNQLTNLLKGHAIGQSLSPSKLGRAGEIASLYGGNTLNAVKTDSGGIRIGDANVVESIKTPNGFIHILDSVLGGI